MSKRKKSGPVFNPATGAATAGGPQHPAGGTNSNIAAVLAELAERHKSAPTQSGGPHREQPLAEFRHRKPVRHGKP